MTSRRMLSSRGRTDGGKAWHSRMLHIEVVESTECTRRAQSDGLTHAQLERGMDTFYI